MNFQRFKAASLFLAGVIFFSTSASFAQPNCALVHVVVPPQIEEAASKVYYAITHSASGRPTNFTRRDHLTEEFAHTITDPQVREFANFTYEKMNDPTNFKYFVQDLLLESMGDTQAVPTREQILVRAKAIMTEEGFQFAVANHFFEPEEFKTILRSGTALIETDSKLTEQGHGLDTHIMQLAYLSVEFKKAYGPGSLLRFYKSLGDHKFVWDHLLDSPDREADHLGGPRVMSRALQWALKMR